MRPSHRLLPLTLGAGLCLAGIPAGRAQQPPAANANISNGLDHQPTAGDVGRREQNAGIAPSAQQDRARTDEVEKLGQHIMNMENNDPLVNPQAARRAQPPR